MSWSVGLQSFFHSSFSRSWTVLVSIKLSSFYPLSQKLPPLIGLVVSARRRLQAQNWEGCFCHFTVWIGGHRCLFHVVWTEKLKLVTEIVNMVHDRQIWKLVSVYIKLQFCDKIVHYLLGLFSQILISNFNIIMRNRIPSLFCSSYLVLRGALFVPLVRSKTLANPLTLLSGFGDRSTDRSWWRRRSSSNIRPKSSSRLWLTSPARKTGTSSSPSEAGMTPSSGTLTGRSSRNWCSRSSVPWKMLLLIRCRYSFPVVATQSSRSTCMMQDFTVLRILISLRL